MTTATSTAKAVGTAPLVTTGKFGYAALLAVATALLVACGGSGAPGLTAVPSRTAGARPSVTATLPELSRSESRPEVATGTAEPPSPARSAPRPAPPTEIPATTAVPEQQAPGPVLATPPPSTTSSPSPAVATAPAESPSWLWWLLGTIVVAVAVSVPLLLRARRRKLWHDHLAAAEREIAWLARSLVPVLRRAASPDEAVGAWTVEASRVSALEDRLTELAATARDDAGRSRALELRDAVRSADRQLNGVVGARQFNTLAYDVDTVAAELEVALAAAEGAGAR
jgi:hypothetical protein